MKATLAFMAAGFGSRFGGGVKQIEPIGPNGEVLMDYAACDALNAGFDRIVFIIRKDLERDFREGVGKRWEEKCDVDYAFQRLDDLPNGFSVPEGRKKPWGTGQAVLTLRNLVNEPFCVLNADDYYGPRAFHSILQYITAEENQSGLNCCMAGYVLGNTLSESGGVTRGVCHTDSDGFLIGLDETRNIVLENGLCGVRKGDSFAPLDPALPVSMNIWGLPPIFLDYLSDAFAPFLRAMPESDLSSEFLMPDVMGKMVRAGDGRVKVLPTADRWFGMTYAQDKLEAKDKIRDLIRSGAYPERI